MLRDTTVTLPGKNNTATQYLFTSGEFDTFLSSINEADYLENISKNINPKVNNKQLKRKNITPFNFFSSKKKIEKVLNNIPIEIWSEIFSNLNFMDLMHIRRVCLGLKNIVDCMPITAMVIRNNFIVLLAYRPGDKSAITYPELIEKAKLNYHDFTTNVATKPLTEFIEHESDDGSFDNYLEEREIIPPLNFFQPPKIFKYFHTNDLINHTRLPYGHIFFWSAFLSVFIACGVLGPIGLIAAPLTGIVASILTQVIVCTINAIHERISYNNYLKNYNDGEKREQTINFLESLYSNKDEDNMKSSVCQIGIFSKKEELPTLTNSSSINNKLQMKCLL